MKKSIFIVMKWSEKNEVFIEEKSNFLPFLAKNPTKYAYTRWGYLRKKIANNPLNGYNSRGIELGGFCKKKLQNPPSRPMAIVVVGLPGPDLTGHPTVVLVIG